MNASFPACSARLARSRRFPAVLTLLMASAMLLFLSGCESEPVEKGVVAKVNGEPIYLAQLEAEYDLLHLSWAGAVSPTVAKLRKEYGQLLVGLIVHKLVFQELEEHGLTISDEEVAGEEAKVRADYPEGGFDRVLIEEYIDLGVWREQLRAQLAVKKMMTEVLEPGIVLEYQEIDSYYNEHMQDLVIPARVHFLLLAASNKEIVENATAAYMQHRDVEKVQAAFPQVTIQEMKVREDRLSASWNRALTEIVSGDASPAMAGLGGYESVILLERIPEKKLDSSQAFPLIKKILTDAKLQQAFSAWLEEKVASSEILITSHLTPDAGKEDELEEAEADLDLDQDGMLGESDEPGDMYVDPLLEMSDLVNPDIQYGRIWITTEPAGATVRILNIEPAFSQGMEIDAGHYDIEVGMDGYQTQKERVDVFLGQDTIIRFKLTKKGQGDPLAAIVELSPIGEQPPFLEEDLEGIAEDTEPEVNPDLDFGRIFVTTEPEGGTVRVLNIAPKFRQGIEVSEGMYDIDVSMDGYIQQEKSVEVKLGYDTVLHFILTRISQGEAQEPTVELKPIVGEETEEGDAAEAPEQGEGQ